jgi:hypothetical protein
MLFADLVKHYEMGDVWVNIFNEGSHRRPGIAGEQSAVGPVATPKDALQPTCLIRTAQGHMKWSASRCRDWDHTTLPVHSFAGLDNQGTSAQAYESLFAVAFGTVCLLENRNCWQKLPQSGAERKWSLSWS